MIVLVKLITGEFVIGKKNEKEKVLEKPVLVVPTGGQGGKVGAKMIDYFFGLTKKPVSIPFSCIMFDIEPLQGLIDEYSNVISPLSVPKKKLIDLATHKHGMN